MLSEILYRLDHSGSASSKWMYLGVTDISRFAQVDKSLTRRGCVFKIDRHQKGRGTRVSYM
jgi:hypothetical protein